MAISFVDPGSYTLGGISAPRTGMAEEFQAGLQANLGRQETRQAMLARAQAMQLAAADEERKKAAFAAQQAARAAAAASAAQQRAALAELTKGLAGLVPPGARSTATISPAAPPPGIRPSVPLSYGALKGGEGLEGLSGGAEVDRLGLPAVPVAGLTYGPPTRPRVGPSQAISDLYSQLSTPPASGLATTGVMSPGLVEQLGVTLDGLPSARERMEAYRAGQVNTLPAFAPAPVVGESPVAAALGIAPDSAPATTTPELAASEPADTVPETEPTATPPTKKTSWGGLQLDYRTPVQLSFGKFAGRGSEAYVSAPENIFKDAEAVERQRQRLQLLLTYYQRTGNADALVGTLNELEELAIEQRYLDGMTAIAGIQQENFGPLQLLLEQRYPGQQVEVRPYTDRTVEIFVNGEAQARLGWDEVAADLRDDYDRGFIEMQQALAAEVAERSRLVFEETTKAEAQAVRDIAIARDKADIDRYEKDGKIERIGETANGEAIFQTTVDGVPVQFVYRETVTRDPATGKEVPALIATPIDQSLVR